jgi:tRNA-binding protein
MTHVIDPEGLPYAPEAVGRKPEVGVEPLAALDLRVGIITAVEDFPAARKPAWKLTVDLGPLGELRSSAQLRNYTTEELVGRRVVCAVNLGDRRIAGFTSELLVLAGLAPDGTPQLLGVDGELAPGSVVA